jgi:hypothetical protein
MSLKIKSYYRWTPYVKPYVKKTGIGATNLWCGTHIVYASDSEDDEEDLEIMHMKTVTVEQQIDQGFKKAKKEGKVIDLTDEDNKNYVIV